MIEEIEQLSYKEDKIMKHPKISFVLIHGKNYICTLHDLENLNRGAMRQHIEGRQHKINFYPGKKIKSQLKNLEPIILESQEIQESEPQKLIENHIPIEPTKEKTPFELTLEEIRQTQDDNLLLDVQRWKLILDMGKAGLPQEKIQEYKEKWDFQAQKIQTQSIEAQNYDQNIKHILILRESDPYVKSILAEYFFGLPNNNIPKKK